MRTTILCGVAVVGVMMATAGAFPEAPEPPDVPPPEWTPAGQLYLRAMQEQFRNRPPATGWTTHARIVEVYDGDTITVEVTRRFRVRLLDCWAPEIRTRDAAEKARGLAAAAYLTELAEGKPAILHVPLDGIDAGDAWSFGRVLGSVWIDGDDKPLAAHMRDAGHATKEKRK